MELECESAATILTPQLVRVLSQGSEHIMRSCHINITKSLLTESSPEQQRALAALSVVAEDLARVGGDHGGEQVEILVTVRGHAALVLVTAA